MAADPLTPTAGAGAAGTPRSSAATPAAASTERPATVEEIITGLAKQHGISPTLALAVARKESGLNPSAVGDGGLALGTFQLHAGAAKDTGVDRADPIGNITGGIKYLKQLSDYYQGDVQKTLLAYNGGMGNVDRGTISPEAQAYAAEVLAQISGQVRGQAGAAAPPGTTPPSTLTPRVPVAGRGTAATNIGATAPQNIRTATAAIDPRTAGGRQNLAGMAGSVAGAVLTGGSGGAVPVALSTGARILRFLGPIIGAGTVAGTEAAAETALGVDAYAGQTPGEAGLQAGTTQAGYEAAGRYLIWPVISRVGRTLLSPNIARSAAEGLHTAATVAKEEGRAALDTIRSSFDETLRVLRTAGRQAVAAAREGVEAVQASGARDIAAARAASAARLADAELTTAGMKVAAEKVYDDLLRQQTAQAADAPGLVLATRQEPAERALRAAGERVGQAAAAADEAGLRVELAPLQAALEAMLAAARPAAMRGAKPKPGFVPPASLEPPKIMPRRSGSTNRITREEYDRLYTPAVMAHPKAAELTGWLDQIQSGTVKDLSFSDAHKLKLLLDESVYWDRTAKKHVEKITKGLRTVLREQLSTSPEYNTATAAYQAVVPLYRQGLGKTIQKALTDVGMQDRLGDLLKGNEPVKAAALKSLLIDQAAAGGDAALGARAWDGVRASYTAKHLLKGGIDQLQKNLDTLLTKQPEFAKIVYGDASGGQVLFNLGQIADAAAHATQALKAGPAIAPIEQAAVEGVQARVTAAVRQAKQGARATAQHAAEEVSHAQAGKSAAVREQLRANRAREGVAADRIADFRDSTLAPFVRRTTADEGADIIRASAMGPSRYWGALSIMRLLRSASADDLLYWMSNSPQRTQTAVRILTNRTVAPEVVSGFLREAGGVLGAAPVHTEPATRLPRREAR